MAQNLTEKIAQRYAVELAPNAEVRAGDFVSIRPAHVMTHDNTSAVMAKFRSSGAKRIHDPAQPVFALDHDIQNTSPENLAKYAAIEAFARRHSIAFFPAGRGISHQVMVEEGFVLPGTFVVGSDSHSNLYGAMGALGTPVVRTDAAAIWATGRTWWQVPDVVGVHLAGGLPPGVVGKDVIVALCGVFNHDEVLNCCIEFTGPGVACLGIEERMTISNMTTEWGALSGIFAYDTVTRDYLLGRADQFRQRKDPSPRITKELVEALDAKVPQADPGASYAKRIEFDLSAVTPFVSGPNTVKDITALADLERRSVRIDKAYLMSCVNGRVQDFESAAAVMKGRKVAKHVEFYIAAASDEVEQNARANGSWQALVDAGAIELPPGCGACIGLGRGTLKAGEVGISATNRNFRGRMGSRDASVYLSSPAVVAASAVAGMIAGPDFLERGPSPAHGADALSAMRHSASCRATPRPVVAPSVNLLPGFPRTFEGELLFVPADNLNTDGIYGKDYTYREDMTPQQMAAVAMANYDPAFQSLARQGDILVGGYNFGTGSSREQAVTALKHRGMRMIIASSFSQTYKRNAFNNGYVVIECPDLVDDLKAAFAAEKKATIRTGWWAKIDFVTAMIHAGHVDGRGGSTEQAREYTFSPLGEVAQELIVKGGFEAVIAETLASG